MRYCKFRIGLSSVSKSKNCPFGGQSPIALHLLMYSWVLWPCHLDDQIAENVQLICSFDLFKRGFTGNHRKPLCLIINTMVSCRYSLHPIHCKLKSKPCNQPLFTSDLGSSTSSSHSDRKLLAPSQDMGGFHSHGCTPKSSSSFIGHFP